MANTTATVKITWGYSESLLRKGTPLGSDGEIANDANAYGILAEDIHLPDRDATVITAGEWDEDEGYLMCGIALTDEAKEALNGITFKHPVHHYVEAGDTATTEKAGLVKMAEAVPDSEEDDYPTAEEFNDLLAKLRSAGILAETPEEPETTE